MLTRLILALIITTSPAFAADKECRAMAVYILKWAEPDSKDLIHVNAINKTVTRTECVRMRKHVTDNYRAGEPTIMNGHIIVDTTCASCVTYNQDRAKYLDLIDRHRYILYKLHTKIVLKELLAKRARDTLRGSRKPADK